MELTNSLEKYMGNLEITERSEETKKGYRSVLTDFKRNLESKNNGAVYVEEITQEDIENHLLYLKKDRELAPASRSRVLYVLKSFFSYLNDSGLVLKNPTRMIAPIKLQQKEREHLTKEEVIELSNEIERPVIKVLVKFLYFTGLRITEATSLKLDNIDFEEKSVKVIAGKGNKDRTVPLNDKGIQILRDYIENIRPKVNSNYFFTTNRTGRVSPQYVNRQINEAVKRLGWNKKISAHILRHSYATALVEKNVNIIHISRLLGHSSVKVTSIYAHSKMDELRKAVQNL